MWLSTILGAAGTAASGIMSTINNRRMKQEQDAEAARQQAHYEAMANENPLSRSENQYILGQYDRAAQQQIEKAGKGAAIIGATPEYAAAVQKGVAEGRANLMGQMSASASRRADYYKQLGENARHQHSLDEIARRKERDDTFAAIAANAANAASTLAGGIDWERGAEAPKTKKTPAQVEAHVNALQTVTDETKPMSVRLESAKTLVPGLKATYADMAANKTAQEHQQKLAAAEAVSTPPSSFLEANKGIYTDPYDNYFWLNRKK